MFRWRKMTWVLLAWVALIIAWIVAGVNSVDGCENEPSHLRDACQLGTEIGTGIGVAVVVLIGFMGFVVLSLIWFMTRPKGAPYVMAVEGDHSAPVDRPAPTQPKPAGWYRDPGGRYDLRYFDQVWTDHVANDGDDNTYVDPVPRL